MGIDGELRRKVSSKLPSINQAMLRNSWFYLSKTTHFVMPTKKQTRQRNARNRRNQCGKHHRKATCAKLFGGPVSTPISVPKSMQNHSKIDQFSTQIGPKSTSATNFGRLKQFRARLSASWVDLGRPWVDHGSLGLARVGPQGRRSPTLARPGHLIRN